MSKRVQRARDMIGVPYLHLGRDRNGIDCVGLLAYADEVDLSIVPAYPENPLNNELETNLTRYYGMPEIEGHVELRDLMVGDIVAMHYKGPIRHVAIVGDYLGRSDKLSLIHTDSNLGRVTEHRLDAKWVRRIKRVYRT